MRRPRAILAACCVILTATTAPGLTTAQDPAPQPFVGKTWVSTDSTAVPGTLRTFLPDGTLVMDSCSETHRLTAWRSLGSRLIEWREDAARIEAEVTQSGPSQLRLRMRLRGEARDEHYQLATLPFVCPDAKADVGAPATRIATRTPTSYRCAAETFKVAFQEELAYVTVPDGSLTALSRLDAGPLSAEARRFSNGRLTFVQEGGTAAASRVSFARGRMAPVPCTQQN